MIEIRKIGRTRRDLKKFIQFAIHLYKGNAYYVPPMIESEIDILDDQVNPAFDFCESVYFMAFRDGMPVGRIAGFINSHANEKFQEGQCRFGFVDFIDDPEVSRILLDAVRQWGGEKGMDVLMGPMGMTDLDYEGCLIEGFDQLATSQTIYNYPYYPQHFERYGLHPDVYAKEYKMKVPEAVPEKYTRITQIVTKRLGLRVIQDTDAKHIVKHWGDKIFQLLNEAYAPLYGFTELTPRQIDYYIHLWLPQVRLDLLRMVIDKDNQLIAFGICCPSLSRAQQKAKGRMWPFGWMHLAKAMYFKGGTDTFDLLLVAVRSDYQGKGVHALLFPEIIDVAIKSGFQWAESNPELESNDRVQEMWKDFSPVCHKRRCIYKMNL
ncbi:MAG: N-acetyltransferase [Bacteroidales bacterium]|nr:N-acetyltransferase [Bacteroidales bacterium]